MGLIDIWNQSASTSQFCHAAWDRLGQIMNDKAHYGSITMTICSGAWNRLNEMMFGKPTEKG